MKTLAFALVVFVMLLNSSTIVFAEDDVYKDLEDNLSKYSDKIDYSDLDEYINSLQEDAGSLFSYGFKKFVDDMVRGEFNSGYTDFWSMVLKLLTINIASLIPVLASIVAIGVLCSMSSSLASGFMKKSTIEIIHFVCYAMIIILVVTTLTSVASMATKTVNNLNTLIDIIFPIMLTLVTALGGSVTVTVYQGSLAIMSSLITTIISKLIIPAFLAVIVFSIVGNISSNIKLDKLSATIKNSAEWLMGISFGLYMIILAFQGVGGAAFDGISVKAMKFMVSSYVPILGGYLSEGFDVIMASCVLIKNAVGITSVMLILVTILSPVIKIIVLTIGLKFAAAILEPLGDKRISDFLFLVSKSTTLLISAILGTGLILIASIMLLIVTCNGGVI